MTLLFLKNTRLKNFAQESGSRGFPTFHASSCIVNDDSAAAIVRRSLLCAAFYFPSYFFFILFFKFVNTFKLAIRPWIL